MNERIDLIKAELCKSPTLEELYRLEDRVDDIIAEVQDTAEMSLLEAEGVLLATLALGRQIIVENPFGLDSIGALNQSLAESDR